MAFNINAAVVLSGPKNIQKVSSSIKKQLSNINVPVKIQLDKSASRGIKSVNNQLNSLNTTLSTLQKNAASTAASFRSLAGSTKSIQGAATKVNSATNSVNKSLANTAKSAGIAGSALQDFGKDAALAVRRFAAFSAATGVIFGFTRAVGTATKEAIQFQRELAKITQVTGQAGKNLEGLRSTIDGLSTGLGLGANELLGVARTFAQTGQSIEQVRKSLAAVAKASLAPTFGDIKQTTEGAIAALSQFKLEANALEGVLGSLNQVSKRFAVESDDLISVIRRAGGVFAASSQQLGAPEERLRELIGIFTAVRSTTRESADTIATGLRTIFTRIQRPQTIEFLKQFGVQLRASAEDAKALGIREGDFIGVFEALKRISAASKGLDTLQTARLVEELGGVRQVGKLIPALQNFEKAEKAVQVALEGRGSVAKDVGIATQTLAVQIEQLQQRFGKLIRDIADSSTFQNLARFAIQTANAFITLADALRPILPALTAIAAVKIGAGTLEITRGFLGGIRKGGGAAGVGAGLANVATGGSAAQQTANQKQAAAAASKNTTALTSNTSA
jgi:TP901 family phage tail tape measure protein